LKKKINSIIMAIKINLALAIKKIQSNSKKLMMNLECVLIKIRKSLLNSKAIKA
jgi:hypothetical protein